MIDNWLWIFLLVIPLGIYTIHVLGYMNGLNHVGEKTTQSEENFSHLHVIVPLRNEEENVVGLFESLRRQTYPTGNWTLWLVDDGSTDRTLEITKEAAVDDLHFKILVSNGEGKKDAIRTAEENIKDGIIVVTDADCRFQPGWLESIARSQGKKAGLLILPVLIERGKGVFKPLFVLESISLLGTSIGSAGNGNPVLCSGANLSYSSSLLSEISRRGEQYSSGDDMFLLEGARLQRNIEIRGALNSELVVKSMLPGTLKEFVHQRMRWAGKSLGFKDMTMVWHGLIVWFVNVIILVALIASVFYESLLFWAVGAFLVKSLIDFLFLFLVASRVKRKKYLRYFPIVEILYLPYAALIPILSLGVKPNWRGRKVK